MLRIDSLSRHALYAVEATRRIETLAQSTLPPHSLMQRAGSAVARLALALAPHSRRIWIACGAGNNGGDGLEAALHLQRSGKSVLVTWLGSPGTAPPDASASHQRALAGGVRIAQSAPDDCDLCIDALLGIGAARAPQGQMADWIRLMNAASAMVLAVDVPTGLQADTGAVAEPHIRAHHTLSLLTLKPGLFTAHGRDASGTVWFDDLALATSVFSQQQAITPAAWLAGEPAPAQRLHASHKGSYGDIAIIGGATGMTGATLLAGSAALHAGAGRVFIALLDNDAMKVDIVQPELMFRPIDSLDFKPMTVVCGCGGGDAIRGALARILSTSARLVIDADALNRIAVDSQFQTLLRARGRRGSATVLTPHPLEAARLLDCAVLDVQGDRIAAAQLMAKRFDCTVVLKGSGSVVAAPDQTPVINSTGNARLASAGTGDVLSGMIGARLAAGMAPFEAAWQAVYHHGLLADRWPPVAPALTAARLAQSQ